MNFRLTSATCGLKCANMFLFRPLVNHEPKAETGVVGGYQFVVKVNLMSQIYCHQISLRCRSHRYVADIPDSNLSRGISHCSLLIVIVFAHTKLDVCPALIQS